MIRPPIRPLPSPAGTFAGIPIGGLPRIPAAQPGALAGVVHPLDHLAALAAALWHAPAAVMNRERQLNQFYALQEDLRRDRGGTAIAPRVVAGEPGSARWAYEILHSPWQTRQFIHPRGG